MSQHAPSDRVDTHTGLDLRRNRADDGVEVAASRLDNALDAHNAGTVDASNRDG